MRFSKAITSHISEFFGKCDKVKIAREEDEAEAEEENHKANPKLHLGCTNNDNKETTERGRLLWGATN